MFRNEKSVSNIDIINMSKIPEYVNKYLNKQSINVNKIFNLIYQ